MTRNLEIGDMAFCFFPCKFREKVRGICCTSILLDSVNATAIVLKRFLESTLSASAETNRLIS